MQARPLQHFDVPRLAAHVARDHVRSLAELAALAACFRERCVLEASGGVGLGNVRAVAETGVHRISIGALTHSAPHVDIALEVAAWPGASA